MLHDDRGEFSTLEKNPGQSAILIPQGLNQLRACHLIGVRGVKNSLANV